MKKIVMFIGLFVAVLTLSGCDFLSDDLQDQISEELCKNDPDNELCDLDALQDLEDQVVTNFVEEFQMKVQDGTLAEVCEEFISPSNPNLLEQCRNDELVILPEGVTTFTSSSVTEDGNTYSIKGEEEMDGKELYVKVVIVEVEGVFYIEDYSYMTVVPDRMELTETKAYDFYQSFFDMLLDENKTNQEFCDIFYDGIDDDCNLFRNQFMEDYRDITMIEMLGFSEAKVHGHVTVLKAKEDTGGEGFEFTLELSVNEEDEIKVKDSYRGENPLYEAAETAAMNALYDFIDPTITNDEFFLKYDFANHNTVREKRTIATKMYGAVIPLFSDQSTTKTSMYFQFREEFGQVQGQRLDVSIVATGDTVLYKYEFIEPEIITDLPTAKANIDSFFDIFTDIGENRMMYSNMYYGSGMNIDTFVNRESCDTDMFTVEQVYETEILGEFVVRAKFPPVPCSDGRSYSLNIRVNRWESRVMLDINDIDNDCDGICEVDDRTDLFMMYSLYLDDYMSKEVTDTMLEDTYFEETLPRSFFDIRKEVQDKKNRSLHEVIGPVDENTYIFVLIETEGDMMRIVEDKIKITKRVDKATPLLSIVDPDSDDDSIPIDEKLALNNNLQALFNRVSIANYDACRLNVPVHRIDKCTPLRQSTIDMGYIVHKIELLIDMDGNNFLRIRRRPDLLTQEWDELIDTSLAYYYYDENNMLVVEMIHVPDGISDPIEYEDDWESVVMAINDTTIPQDEVCMKVSTSSYDTCSSMRARVTNTSSMIVTTSMEMIEGVQHFTVDYQTADGTPGAVYVYRLLYVNDAEHNYSVLEIMEITPTE